MESQSDGNIDIASVKEIRQQLETRLETVHSSQLDLVASLQTLVPDIVSSLDLSLQVVSAFNGRPFTPLPTPLPNPPNSNRFPKRPQPPPSLPQSRSVRRSIDSPKPPPPKLAKLSPPELPNSEKFTLDESRSPLSVVRSMVAVCLLERVPFDPIDSSTVLRKLENDQSATPAEKAALRELGGESGAILAVEMALRSMAEENGGIELEPFALNGKSRVMVLHIDRTRLMKELPESKQYLKQESSSSADRKQNHQGGPSPGGGGGGFGMGGPRPMPDMWMGPPLFPGTPPGPMMGRRNGPRGGAGGMMSMPRGMAPPIHRTPLLMNAPSGGSNAIALKPTSEEDDLKDVEALLNKKSFKEMQMSKTGEELLDLLFRPTSKEIAIADRFKNPYSQLKEYCTALTKEDCRRQSGSYIACEKVHFRRIIAMHTDVSLGDCSFLDTCRHMKTCKYVHYELDNAQDAPMMMGTAAFSPQKALRSQRAEYCSEVELGESQWINCDIRNFRMDILGQFGVIMADPPWDIHMELPYGTMADDEMRSLNVPALQTDGLIFLWVTGRAMELGRECLELWGYKRVEEVIWVKTNQLQRIIRTGRTGHWLNHSKEHCLVGIKGSPLVNRNIDTDVLVAEVRETSRKPDEMYPLLERISPGTRKLELFARMHNTHAGWMSLGNQLSGARLVDEGLRARFKAAYPDVEVQPPSPPRAAAAAANPGGGGGRSPFADNVVAHPPEPTPSFAAAAEQKPPMNSDVDMMINNKSL